MEILFYEDIAILSPTNNLKWGVNFYNSYDNSCLLAVHFSLDIYLNFPASVVTPSQLKLFKTIKQYIFLINNIITYTMKQELKN